MFSLDLSFLDFDFIASAAGTFGGTALGGLILAIFGLSSSSAYYAKAVEEDSFLRHVSIASDGKKPS